MYTVKQHLSKEWFRALLFLAVTTLVLSDVFLGTVTGWVVLGGAVSGALLIQLYYTYLLQVTYHAAAHFLNELESKNVRKKSEV